VGTLFEEISVLSDSSHFIILGDFNKAWGLTRSNPSGVALSKFLANSPLRFLNDGSGTRVSASLNYVSVPDITITNCTDQDFRWTVGEDPMGSDHLPVTVIFSNRITLSEACVPPFDYNTPKKPKLSLNNFDKDFFPLIVREGMNTLSLDHCLVDPLQSWYDLILECAIRAGAVLPDGLGNKTEYIGGKISTLPLRKSTRVKYKACHNSPWWDR